MSRSMKGECKQQQEAAMDPKAVHEEDEQPPSNPRTPRRYVRQQVPDQILRNPALIAATAVFPPNYNLEIPKTVWRIKQVGAKRVALQFPEGLLMYSLAICDILEEFAGVEECFVLGDVTYGACCLDDFSAVALGAEFLVHYGHSCLVPIEFSQIPCLYVFVDIQIDVLHLVDTVKYNFTKEVKIALAGTIQFVTAIHAAEAALSKHFVSVVVPQTKPLSPGEVLGCTSPSLPEGIVDVVVFVADGRFHLESFMIANPKLRAFRYDPYLKVLCLEEYDHKGMKEARRKAMQAAQHGRRWGIILGTLGRQGNPKVLKHIEQRLASRHIEYYIFLISEISPIKIALFEDTVDVWVQIACPRLSIDWGESFSHPLLTPFEAEMALGYIKPWWCLEETGDGIHNCTKGKDEELIGSCSDTILASTGNEIHGTHEKVSNGDEEGIYPMDYYARDGGPWNSFYMQTQRFQKHHLKTAH